MELVESMDLFGTNFNFSIFKRNKFKTFLGGILSILSLGICVLITLFFGRDFFYRMNPKILSQVVQPKKMDNPIKLKDKKLVLPWRIEDVNGVPVDFSKFIYPTLYEIRYSINSTTGFFELDKQKIIKNERCNNQTGNMSEFNENFNITDWYCPDWMTNDEYLIGGLWDDKYVFYYEFKIGYCPEAGAYSEEKNCTSLESLNNIFLSDNPYLISILYPKYSFDPNNNENPMQLSFINYYYYLSVELKKTDRIYFKLAKLNDDRGWIFNEIINHSVITFNRFASDFSFFDTKNYYNPGVSSSFYNLNIYFERDYDLLYRSYMKFQNLCADVGGCLKIIMTVFGILAFFYNINSRKNMMFEELFDLIDLREDKIFDESVKNKKNNSHNFLKLETKYAKINPNLNEERIKRNKSINISDLTNSKNILNPDPLNVFSKHYSFKSQFLDLKKRQKSKKMSFNIFFTLKAFLCPTMILKKDRDKYIIFKEMDSYFNKRLDVIFYLKNMIIFDKLKEMQLNPIQNLSLNYFQKEHIYNFLINRGEKDINSKEKVHNSEIESNNRSKIINYFSEKLVANKMSDVDLQIFNSIDLSLKHEVKKSIIKNRNII